MTTAVYDTDNLSVDISKIRNILNELKTWCRPKTVYAVINIDAKDIVESIVLYYERKDAENIRDSMIAVGLNYVVLPMEIF